MFTTRSELAFNRSILDGSEATKAKEKDAEPGASTLLEPEVRVNFADTALWMPTLALDENGKAETNICFPQSLTSWRLHGYALTQTTQVGDATNEVTTTKNLLVRLEAPRFFVERDEVVLSANVHNYLKAEKNVRVCGTCHTHYISKQAYVTCPRCRKWHEIMVFLKYYSPHATKI